MTISAYLAPVAKLQFTDDSGAFLAGGKLFTYVGGTTNTKATTYQDAAMATPNTNPIILDTEGRCTVFLPPGQFFKFVLSPSTDTDPPSNPIWTVDNLGVAANGIPYAVDTGAANAMVATYVGIPSIATAGTTVVIDPGNAPTGASTFNATPAGGTAWGPLAIKDAGGNAVTNGAWAANQPLLLTYDGTFWRTQFYNNGSRYAVDAGTSGVLVATVPAIPTSPTTGAWCLVKAANAAAGSDTLNTNTWGAILIKKAAGASTSANDFAAGQVIFFIYDGTNWRTLF